LAETAWIDNELKKIEGACGSQNIMDFLELQNQSELMGCHTLKLTLTSCSSGLLSDEDSLAVDGRTKL
jgi:hypothetical protein